MGVFAGTERQCTEDEDEHDSQISEFGFKHSPYHQRTAWGEAQVSERR